MKIEMATIGVGSPFKDMIAASRGLPLDLAKIDTARADADAATRKTYLPQIAEQQRMLNEKGGEDREPKEDEWFSKKDFEYAHKEWVETHAEYQKFRSAISSIQQQMDKELVDHQRDADQMKEASSHLSAAKLLQIDKDYAATLKDLHESANEFNISQMIRQGDAMAQQQAASLRLQADQFERAGDAVNASAKRLEAQRVEIMAASSAQILTLNKETIDATQHQWDALRDAFKGGWATFTSGAASGPDVFAQMGKTAAQLGGNISGLMGAAGQTQQSILGSMLSQLRAANNEFDPAKRGTDFIRDLREQLREFWMSPLWRQFDQFKDRGMFGSREDMQTAERLIAQFDELEKTRTLQEKAKEIAEAVRTPMEKLQEVIGQYKDMLAHHAIGQTTFDRAVNLARHDILGEEHLPTLMRAGSAQEQAIRYQQIYNFQHQGQSPPQSVPQQQLQEQKITNTKLDAVIRGLDTPTDQLVVGMPV